MILAASAWSAAPGCGDKSIASVAIRIHQPPPLDSTGKCPVDPPPVPLSRGPNGPTTLRLTYRRSGGGTLLCDVIVPIEGMSAYVGVPTGMETKSVDLLVESFRGDASLGAVLVGSGEALNADLDGGPEISVEVAPRDEFRCTDRRMIRGRAFHSMTTLPNGEVLIVGGIVPDPADASNTRIDLSTMVAGQIVGGFYATNSVEIYDPQHGSFRELVVPGLLPRALHEAYLLPMSTDGGYPILLAGGITVSGDPATTPAIDGVRDGPQPMRVVPAPGAVGAPTEVLTYYPDGRAPSSVMVQTGALAARMLQAATRPHSAGDDPNAVPQTPPILAGGYSAYGASSSYFSTFEEADLATGTSVGSGWMLVPPARVGATVTRLGGDRALVWGGNLTSTAGNEPTETGDVLAALSSATPMSALATFGAAPAIPPAPRVFATSVAVDPDNVLVVGGFSLAGGSTGDPVAPFGQLVTVGPAAAITITNETPAAGVPAGFVDSSPLLGGDFLFTGGNEATSTAAAPCTNPEMSTGTHLCSVAHAYRWHSAAHTLDHLDATPLLISRWGHKSAVLLDGTVLITGGFHYGTSDDGSGVGLTVVREGELYNSRTELQDPAADSLSGLPPRKPGDIARKTDGTPFSECKLVQ